MSDMHIFGDVTECWRGTGSILRKTSIKSSCWRREGVRTLARSLIRSRPTTLQIKDRSSDSSATRR